MGDAQWHYSRSDDHQAGPVSAKELNRLAEANELRPDDLVWKEGMPEWVPASRLKALKFASVYDGAASARQSRALDAERVRELWHDAQQRADEAAGVLWFLDLRFRHFVTASAIRIAWATYLGIVAIGLLAAFIGGILQIPILQFLIAYGGLLLLVAFGTLMFRIGLESLAILFRIADDLSEIRASSAGGGERDGLAQPAPAARPIRRPVDAPAESPLVETATR